MKTWRPLEVPVSKSKSIFNSLKRRKQPQEDKLLLPPGCDCNRAWNAIWEEISEFPPNALKIKNLTTLARTDTQYIHYYQQSMCAQEKERSHGNSGEQAEEELTCLHHRCRSGASCFSCDHGREVKAGLHSGLMFQKFWSYAPYTMIFFSSTAWRVFASLMSWSYGVIQSIICSEWLPPWDYKKLQVALVTRELSVILNYWHIFMWYSPKSRAKFSYSSMKSKTQSPPQGKGGI